MTTKDAPCSVPQCGRPHYRRGFCIMHHERLRRRGDPGTAERLYAPQVGLVCSVDGCGNPCYCRGFCRLHYSRHRRLGDPGTAERLRTPRRREARWVDREGYVRLSGDRFEHRVVMEQMLGRPLLPRENVHHLNGVRHDNCPENLELWTRPQPSGQRVTDLVAWVVATYPEYVAGALNAAPLPIVEVSPCTLAQPYS